jgi:uncharacterized protein (UPF0332 family)/predicted nucleotidyltransferase
MTPIPVKALSSQQRARYLPIATIESWSGQFDALLDRTSLNPGERQALVEFLQAVHRQYADDIANIILYGSSARGEKRIESDVDLLILTKRVFSKAEVATLHDCADQVSSGLHCVLSVVVLSPDEQRWHSKGSSLWRNIQQDGIVLWPLSQTPLHLDAGFLYRKNPASGGYVMTEAQYDEIGNYLENSEEELADADLLIRSGMERLAVSRCYYAIFYAASALLLTKGIIRAKHSGTRSALSEYFIRMGTLPEHLGDIYKLLQGEREMADYKLAADPPWEDIAEIRLEQAKEFVTAIRDYLTANQFLTQ